MSTIHDNIAALRKEIDAKLAQVETLTRLSEAFLDLSTHVGNWGKVTYCSKSVNSKATHFEKRRSGRGGDDDPLDVWVYLETPHGKVFTSPPMFHVGYAESVYGGDIPTSGWDSRMRAAGIPEAIIGAVDQHFKKCAREAKASAAETLEVYGDSSEEP